MSCGYQLETMSKEAVLNNFTAKSRHNLQLWSLDSAVGIETSYGLKGPEVRIPAAERDFSLVQDVQTGSGAHPASYG
jgi:hypothetical protein